MTSVLSVFFERQVEVTNHRHIHLGPGAILRTKQKAQVHFPSTQWTTGIATMRFFLAFPFLCIALGIGYALEFDDALESFDQLVDDTARQTNQDLDTIVPVFGIVFTTSLLNNLIFRNPPTPAPTPAPSPAPTPVGRW